MSGKRKIHYRELDRWDHNPVVRFPTITSCTEVACVHGFPAVAASTHLLEQYSCRCVLEATTGMPRINASSVLVQLRQYRTPYTSVPQWMPGTYLPIDDLFHAYWMSNRTTATQQILDARWEDKWINHPLWDGDIGAQPESNLSRNQVEEFPTVQAYCASRHLHDRQFQVSEKEGRDAQLQLGAGLLGRLQPDCAHTTTSTVIVLKVSHEKNWNSRHRSGQERARSMIESGPRPGESSGQQKVPPRYLSCNAPVRSSLRDNIGSSSTLPLVDPRSLVRSDTWILYLLRAGKFAWILRYYLRLWPHVVQFHCRIVFSQHRYCFW